MGTLCSYLTTARVSEALSHTEKLAVWLEPADLELAEAWCKKGRGFYR